jgi:hypothetical protein
MCFMCLSLLPYLRAGDVIDVIRGRQAEPGNPTACDSPRHCNARRLEDGLGLVQSVNTRME